MTVVCADDPRQLVEKYLAEDGIKVIIFSEFVTYLKLVERFLDCNDIPNRMYHGGMRNRDREDVIKEFTGPIKNDRSPRVMLISRKAGGAGLNLTAASKVSNSHLIRNRQLIELGHFFRFGMECCGREPSGRSCPPNWTDKTRRRPTIDHQRYRRTTYSRITRTKVGLGGWCNGRRCWRKIRQIDC